MFRVAFSVSIVGMAERLALGETISHQDDPFRALAEAQDKRPVFVEALRESMPHIFAKAKPGDIQIAVTPYDVQFLLFDLPVGQQNRDEQMPEARIGYELFQNDSAPTLANPGGA